MAGATVQLSASCVLVDSSTQACAGAATGTGYTVANPAVCNVSADGLVTAGTVAGSCMITAVNDGVIATASIAVTIGDDADGDGLPDSYERENACLDDNVADAERDVDADGLTNQDEFEVGSDPCVFDTDGDGLSDGSETDIGTDPTRFDSDGDGASDGSEQSYGTNPLVPDTDDDGLLDGADIALIPCTDPLSIDADLDGVADADEDCDQDDLSNAEEVTHRTNPAVSDTDGDTLLDGDEVDRAGCDPLVAQLGTVAGRMMNGASPVPTARILVSAQRGSSGADGRFVVTDVPACGELTTRIVGVGRAGATRLRGMSAIVTPLQDQVLDVGDVQLAQGPQGPLYPAPKFVSGSRPRAVALGDIDGDGWADAVVGGGTSVSVHLGTGDGQFTAPTVIPIALESRVVEAVALATVDAHSDLDILATTARGPLSPPGEDELVLLPGNGNGTFGSAARFSTGSRPTSMAVGDATGDGIADVVTANAGSFDLSLLAGNGTGSFAPEVRLTAGILPSSVAIAQLDANAPPDLVVADLLSVVVRLGTGGGAFGIERTLTAGSRPVGVATGDFDGDGVTDIAAVNQNSHDVSIFRGLGGGLFGTARSRLAGHEPAMVAVADLRGIGTDDIVVGNGDDSVTVLLGNDDLSFRSRQVYARGPGAEAIAVADLDQDAVPDVVAISGDSEAALTGPDRISVLLGRGDGSLESVQPLQDVGIPLLIADLDLDGEPDMLSIDAGFGLSLSQWKGLGFGRFSFVQQINECANSEAVTADFDRDGRPDVALASANIECPHVRVLLGAPGGALVDGGEIPLPAGGRALLTLEATGDMDPDLVVSSGSLVTLHPGLGDGTFATPSIIIPEDAAALGTGDFDGDGNADLVASTTALVALLGQGDGTFAAPSVIDGSALWPIAVAEATGDAFVDVVGGYGTSTLRVHPGEGDGSFAAVEEHAIGPNSTSISVGDVGGDARPDIVTASGVPGDVSVLIGAPSGFAVERRFVGGAPARLVDLDRDSVPDVVVGVGAVAPGGVLFHR